MAEVLRVGDRDPRVAEARSTLAKLGLLQDYTDQVPDTVAGNPQYREDETYFDARLAHAIKAFQQSLGVVPSGCIDELTLREMRGASYTLGARELELRPAAPLVGNDVTRLQEQLQELGFYSAFVDGHYGPNTARAVANYQLNYGLEVDGVCGRETVRALGLLGRRITGGSRQAIDERETVRRAGPQLTGKRVVIDPALGGRNSGLEVRGRYGSISEEELLWDLAARLKDRMMVAGMEAVLSRPRAHDPDPMARADMANAFNADLMISLQCDRYRNAKANGVATFHFGSETGASSLTGQALSGYIQREIAARTPLRNCGSHARTWDLLRLTRMPTVEVVAGYLTNPDDVATVTNPQNRDAIAEAIVVAVKRLYLLDRDNQPTGTYRFAELLEQERAGGRHRA